MNETFATNLLNLRKQKKMTQEQLASKLGVSFQAVSKWETAKGLPDIEVLPLLASFFGVSVDALLGYKTQKLRTTAYEEKYHSEEYYWGNRVWSGCYEVLKHMPPTRPMRLLDVGCGEGQAAVFFARNGYQVSAFDLAENALKKGRHLAEVNAVEVDFFQADILNYQLENSFDVIYSSGALQYIVPSERERVISNLKKNTAEGGIHLLNVFVEKPFLETPPDWEEAEYFWKSGELFSYYWDWKLELLEEVIFDCDSSGIPHKHCMEVLLAKKPLML